MYIANVIKCRTPNNRNPEPEEVARCEPYLQRQVALVQPKLIVAMGRFAAQSLLKTTASIASLRGRLHEYQNVPVIVTYHPAVFAAQPARQGQSLERPVHGKGHLREATRLSMSSLYDELLATLTDPAVRDLAWLLTSPGLLRAQQSSIRQAQWDAQQMVEIRQWLYDLDQAPAALHAELLRLPQKRLGHYAEQLLAYFLVHGKVGRLIAGQPRCAARQSDAGRMRFSAQRPRWRPRALGTGSQMLSLRRSAVGARICR